MLLTKHNMIDALVANINNWDEVELWNFCTTMMAQDRDASVTDISDWDEFELTNFAQELMRQDLVSRPEFDVRKIYFNSNASRGGGPLV